MKKFLAMILATALLLCACGSNNEPAESTAPIETEPIEEAATGIENTAEFEALNDEELEYNVDYVLSPSAPPKATFHISKTQK